MRLFSIPIELEEEERTFGGVLTLRQVIYIIAALIISVTTFILLEAFGVHIVLNLFFCIPILILGVALAFIKINEVRLDKYLYFLVRYYLRPRLFVLKGDD
ncbi:MAG: PrgI family protein [Firmicutes bacterium]|nr:PrgI family protein [Bacillota bacterium]